MNCYFPRRSSRGHHYRQNPLTVRYHKRSLLVVLIWLNRHNYVNINIVVWWGRHSGNCFGIFTHIYIYIYEGCLLFVCLFRYNFICHKACQLRQILGFPLYLTGRFESLWYFWREYDANKINIYLFPQSKSINRMTTQLIYRTCCHKLWQNENNNAATRMVSNCKAIYQPPREFDCNDWNSPVELLHGNQTLCYP